ncbi:acid protease [Trametes versicolor FP-101664 SS1]|uniref:Acid protease n=1 Tax=Trametes versicolor (strain FP-101664) TaxID=717944 RepID=R7SAR1_TRAVS|nr:acid protease [Trametes versicolor FP-101664 SS1]EIW52039.1 acid protease [Trametes versicolor FP-101664 SS1]
MFSGLRLASTFLLVLALGLTSDALVVRDSSRITLPIARRLNITGAANLVKLDQARAKALKSRPQAHTGNSPRATIFDAPVTNQAVDYVATVGVGSPPTTYSLLIDTGSSNTWVGAGKAYVRTETSQATANLLEVTYGSGFVFGKQGEAFSDTVTVADGLAIENQVIGSALTSQGFDGVDGIIGIGPVDLTCGTLFPAVTECIPTVTDNAFSQGLIGAHEIGIAFAPTQSLESTNGELTFGGIDDTKFTGPLSFVPITSASPANTFVGIDQTVTYGAAGTTVLAATSGITDTGTTLLLLASDAFATYQNLTGGVPDAATGLLSITPDQFANLESLFFHIGNMTLEFTPNAQIWPRALNTAIGGQPDSVYLIVNDLGSISGEGLDFIDGMTFLERFYYVFDIANSRVGFATTEFTDATTN